MNRKLRASVGASVVAASILLVACGSDADDSDTDSTTGGSAPTTEADTETSES